MDSIILVAMVIFAAVEVVAFLYLRYRTRLLIARLGYVEKTEEEAFSLYSEAAKMYEEASSH